MTCENYIKIAFVSISEAFAGTEPHSFTSILSVATFVLQWQSSAFAAETIWPEIFTSLPFTENVPIPDIQDTTRDHSEFRGSNTM